MTAYVLNTPTAQKDCPKVLTLGSHYTYVDSAPFSAKYFTLICLFLGGRLCTPIRRKLNDTNTLRLCTLTTKEPNRDT